MSGSIQQQPDPPGWTAASVAASLQGVARQAFGSGLKEMAAGPADGHRFHLTMDDGREFWVNVEQVNKG